MPGETPATHGEKRERAILTTILLSLLPAQRATLCRFGGAALADLQCQARFEVSDLGGVERRREALEQLARHRVDADVHAPEVVLVVLAGARVEGIGQLGVVE